MGGALEDRLLLLRFALFPLAPGLSHPQHFLPATIDKTVLIFSFLWDEFGPTLGHGALLCILRGRVGGSKKSLLVTQISNSSHRCFISDGLAG